MWEIWDDDQSGEIDFDEFAEMFNMTLLVLEANRKEKESREGKRNGIQKQSSMSDTLVKKPTFQQEQSEFFDFVELHVPKKQTQMDTLIQKTTKKPTVPIEKVKKSLFSPLKRRNLISTCNSSTSSRPVVCRKRCKSEIDVKVLPCRPKEFTANSLTLIMGGIGKVNHEIQPNNFRVLLVDDSKPYRIRLKTMMLRLFENISIEVCATPKEGIKKIMGANTPIHIVIVDQIFVGTKETGKQMCDVLARRSMFQSRCSSPCVLISGSVEVSDEKIKSSSVSNIVECCNKREITSDVILNWFMKYVDNTPIVRRRRSQCLNVGGVGKKVQHRPVKGFNRLMNGVVDGAGCGGRKKSCSVGG